MKHILFSVLFLLILAGCKGESEPPQPAVDVEAGKMIASKSCSACHGMDGRGKTAEIPNLAAQPVGYLVEAMHAYRDGKRHHAALQNMTSGMTEADIANVSAYYSGLAPLEAVAGAVQDETGQSSYGEGAAVAEACTQCHGENGVSDTPGIPSLAGQQPGYLIVSTQEYKDGSRGHAEKEEMLKDLERIDIEKMAMYFASQVPPAREAPPFGDPVAGEPLSASCGGCHGERGISHDPMVPSLASQEPFYLMNAIKAYRDHKREHEEMMTDKSDREIEDIAAYYVTQRAQAAADQSASVQDLAAKCDRCHGPALGKTAIVVPSLKGQNKQYLINVMKAYRDDDRGSSMMHKMSADYSDEVIEQIAAYYAANRPSN